MIRKKFFQQVDLNVSAEEETMTKKLFKAQTSEGYTIKVLADLLQNNIKTACLMLDETGCRLTMYDSHRRVCFSFCLEASNFQIYKFKPTNSLYLGLNLGHFYKMIKSIKKKDSIILFIPEDNPSSLGIRVVPKENNRITTSFIKIQNIQHLDVAVPTGYDNPIIVPSNEYQKMCKDMNSISQVVSVSAEKYSIRFFCDAGSVYSREVSFGETDSDSDSEEEGDVERFSEEFNTEQLARIVKIAGLGHNIHVYVKRGLPMLFRANVGGLGKIAIYIKSKSMIAAEQRPGL